MALMISRGITDTTQKMKFSIKDCAHLRRLNFFYSYE